MKTAIIGLGVIGTVHLSVLLSQGENVSAICDINRSRAEKAAEDNNISPHIYTDFIELIDKEQPDVVHICTPHYLHAEMVVTCLKRNIHVLCEKPLCISEEELSDILNAEKTSEAYLGVCHQNRYNSVNLFLKEFFKKEKAIFANASVVWHRSEAYYKSEVWRGKWETEGGGALINQALHTLDLMQWFFGMPCALSAFKGNLSLPNVIEVEDSAFLRVEGEVPFTFFATVGSFGDFPVQMNARLVDGRVITALPKAVFLDNDLIFSDDVQAYCGKNCYGNGHGALIADFYDCIKTGKKFDIDGEAAGQVIRLILAAYKSHGSRIDFRKQED